MILWRRRICPGTRLPRSRSISNRSNLAGTALFAHGRQSCRLDYEIECDMFWGTRDVTVRGQIGEAPVSLVLSRDAMARGARTAWRSPRCTGALTSTSASAPPRICSRYGD